MIVTLTDRIRFYERAFGAGRLSRNSRNFDVRCPSCDPHDPSKKKLSILTEDDRYHCWVCGVRGRTLAPLLRRFGTHSLLVEYRDRFMAPDAQRWALDVPDVPAKPQLPADFRLLVNCASLDPDVMALRSALVDRQVSEVDQWRFKLGFSTEARWFRRIIIPSFDAAGELNHFVARAIDRHARPKYDAPDNEVNELVFNEINVDWSSRLTLCEGPFDLMKCGDNAVAMLGSDLNEGSLLFNRIIANGTPVALALDADMRYTKLPKLARQFQMYDVDVAVVDVPTDPGEMSKESFKEALGQAVPFDWNRMFFDKLQKASRTRL